MYFNFNLRNTSNNDKRFQESFLTAAVLSRSRLFLAKQWDARHAKLWDYAWSNTARAAANCDVVRLHTSRPTALQSAAKCTLVVYGGKKG